MCKDCYKKVENLTKKIQQHEETITQLVEIIAATNAKVAILEQSTNERKNVFTLN